MAVNGIENVRCPFCHSSNVGQEGSSYAVHAAKGIFAASVGLIGGAIKKSFIPSGPSGATKITNSILEDGSYDYKCNSCGGQFVVEYQKNCVTKVRRHK